MINDSIKPNFLAHIFDILEISSDFNEHAFLNIQKKEKELGTKIPEALKECYLFFDHRKLEDDFLTYEFPDYHPNDASLIRRIKACGLDWNLAYYTSEDDDHAGEDGEDIEVLQFWEEPNGVLSFYCKLDGSENPPVVASGYEITDEYKDDNIKYYTIAPSFTNFITTILFSWRKFKFNSTALIVENKFQTDISTFEDYFNFSFMNTIANFHRKNYIDVDGWNYFTHYYLFLSRNQYVLIEVEQKRNKKKNEGDASDIYYKIKWSANGKAKQDLYKAMQFTIENEPSLIDRFQFKYGSEASYRRFPLALNLPLGNLSTDLDISLAERIAEYVEFGRSSDLLEQESFYDYIRSLIQSDKNDLIKFGLEYLKKMDYDRFGSEFHRYLSKLSLRCLLSRDEDLRMEGGRDEYILPKDYPQLSQLLVDPLVNENIMTTVTRVIRFNPTTKEIFIPNLIKFLESPPFSLYRSQTSILLSLYNDLPFKVYENIVNTYPKNRRDYIHKCIAEGRLEDVNKY